MERADSRGPSDAGVWLAGSGLAACLVMISVLVGVILVKGLGLFWPQPLERLTLRNGEVVLGTVEDREPRVGDPAHAASGYRIRVRVGNRELSGADSRWIHEDDVARRERPADAFLVERREHGPLVGTPISLERHGQVVAAGVSAVRAALPAYLHRAAADRAVLRRVERREIGAINAEIERVRLELRRQDLDSGGRGRDGAARDALGARTADLEREFERVAARLERLREDAEAAVLTVATAGGQVVDVPVLDVYRAFPPNDLGWGGRVGVYAGRLWEFVSGEPRASNTEGGIFPAIFGTVMMVVLMSLAGVPFGVLTALYLREYARQGMLVRLVRIAVNNLAGVPSIVFGVFGLGFFVYFVGGGIDRLLFPESLPAPTFGTGGILWASLTLALLTVPVVIVAAEEALAAVPRSMREASLATGATKFQTIVRVVLPAAAPGIMTGLILAMARGAGEVAPLMLTGVVKLAPDLPLDGTFPFFHLERKFMHLGFHVYDAGFQGPNVEAAQPMVFTTTIFLLLIVLLLNATAVVVRNRLRRRYRVSVY